MKYFNVSWYSKKDGPGTRVVLFLQGCNLHCEWCHSPHSQTQDGHILFYEEYCKNCGRCVSVCEIGNHVFMDNKHVINRANCRRCGKCVLNCTNKALEYKFYEESPSIIFEKIKPELMLLENIGGITVSGGEPLLQYLELKELLKLCKSFNIHTAVETSAAVNRKYFNEIYDYVDCWLFGLKQTNEKLCKKMTGADFDVIEDNLNFLVKRNPEKIIIRTPIIVGRTDNLENIKRIAYIMELNNLKNIQVLPYNPYTGHYYKAIGQEFDEKVFSCPTEDGLSNIIEIFNVTGINAILVR